MLRHKRIIVAGSGRLAAALLGSPALLHHRYVELYARNPIRAHALLQQYHCLPYREDNDQEAVVLLCVNDQSLEETAARFRHVAKVMVHFSGTSALPDNGNNDSAVLWPVHSFSDSEAPVWNNIPWITEFRGSEALHFADDFLGALGCRSNTLNLEQRRELHLAAVVMNNFANHLATLAFDWCKSQQLPVEALHHLSEQTFSRLRFVSPEVAQTGPARRGDELTIEHHLHMLEGKVDLQEIYRIFSKQIRERYL